VRIDHLTVHNFDGFDHREFAFNQHFNLLVGDNATGKTSVLDALSIALGSWFLGIQGYANVLGIDAAEVRVEAHQHLDSYTFEKQYPSAVETRGLVMGRELTWARALSREGGRTSSVNAKAIRTVASDAERRVRAGEEITIPLICTYGTERLWFEATHRKSRTQLAEQKGAKSRRPSRLDGYLDCINFTIQESALLEWIRAEVSASQQRQDETIALKAVKKAIVGCVEGAISLYYDERYKDLIVNLEQFGHQLFTNLSDGQRIVLTLVGDLVKRATTLNPHLEDRVLQQTPGVVLIDELDLHLHPKWQRRIIHDLRMMFPSLQFIATTHSPQLIGEAEPEEVILLGGQEPTNPAQSYGMDSNWILKHVMGADERDAKIKGKLDEAEKLIVSFDLNGARARVDELRAEIGNHPELVRLSARIDRLAEKSP
jgi:predicted ATP-binding protein involved in virulence